MYISKLRLQYFRCYQQLTLDLPAGRNLFVGPNASGKTSLLKAILLLATTRSPRTTYDRELVQWGRSWGQAVGCFEFDSGSPRAIAVTLQDQGSSSSEGEPPPSYLTGVKCVQIDGQAANSVARAVGQAPAVLFTPDDLEIIKGSPGVRRRLLNMAIAQITPRYLADLHRYRRAGWLLELLGSFQQVLVTSVTPSDSLRGADWAAWYELAGGEVRQGRGVVAIDG